ncbi:MAG: 2OG-Fe(II) oxygenase [Myxococcota bacterium]
MTRPPLVLGETSQPPELPIRLDPSGDLPGHPAFGPPLLDAEVEALGDGLALVRDGVLGVDIARAARAEVLALWRAGSLKPAAVGRGAHRERRPEVRGDLTTWLDPASATPALASVHALFESLRDAVNHSAWLGLRAFDVQIALYPGRGARYLRHRDTFRGRAERRLTAIWYANPDWVPADGGALRAFEPAATRSIAPLADRLVLFRSDVLEHAVTPSHNQRIALTAWYRATS